MERFRIVEGGKALEVNVHVEDPGAFTTPWNAVQRFTRSNVGPIFVKGESICAESAAFDYFSSGNYGATHAGEVAPVPHADKPDF